VVVTDSGGRVIEMNRAAERIVRMDDGLTIRSARLGVRCPSEDTKLAKFIAAATVEKKTLAAVSRMIVGRDGGRRPYVLTVSPLSGELAVHNRPLAMVIVTGSDVQSASAQDLADFFGLSPAEGRLAVALMSGKRLADIAIAFGVQVTTLRTQLSSVLKKVGVQRQADLIRVLSSVRNESSREM
jgi:DNA-binding CsgD family transcriptional regulator